jgi:hypothetical protein
MTHPDLTPDLQNLLEHLWRLAEFGPRMPEEDTPLGILTRQFFANNWLNCEAGLLRKTNRIRVSPEQSPAPRAFKFEVDCNYKRQVSPKAPVELVPGPVRGTIYYRPDIFTNTEDPAIAVALDRDQSYLHPNYSRDKGFICLGELPPSPYPFPLDLLLENLIYPIVSYQHRRPVHPFDVEAARYFARADDAMHGLEPAPPLY